MRQFEPEVQSLIDRSVRRGMAVWSEVRRVAERYGNLTADAVAECLQSAGVRFADERDLEITPHTNVLLNELSLVELVSICLQLPVAPRVLRRLHEHVFRRSYELDLQRLEYLDSDHAFFYLTPPLNRLQRTIRRLFDSGQIPFAQYWREGDRRTDRNYLKGLIADPAFTARVLPQIREHYLRLMPVSLLMCWIQATGERAPSMMDVIQAGLAQDGDVAVRQVLLSDRPSSARSALKSRRDVCFSCPPNRLCRPLQGVDDQYSILMAYRSTTLDGLVASEYTGRALGDCLLEDTLIAKFFVPYSLATRHKAFMLGLDILGPSSAVLRKNVGKYCPKVDVWCAMV